MTTINSWLVMQRRSPLVTLTYVRRTKKSRLWKTTYSLRSVAFLRTTLEFKNCLTVRLKLSSKSSKPTTKPRVLFRLSCRIARKSKHQPRKTWIEKASVAKGYRFIDIGYRKCSQNS